MADAERVGVSSSALFDRTLGSVARRQQTLVVNQSAVPDSLALLLLNTDIS